MNNQEMRKVLQEAYCQLCSVPVKGRDTFTMANALARIEGVFSELNNNELDDLPSPTPEGTNDE